MKMDEVSHLMRPLSRKTKAGVAGRGAGRREVEARYAATGQSLEGEEMRGMWSLLLPNCMFLVWMSVMSMPSLEKLTRSEVRNW